MRTKNSIKNSLVTFLANFLTIIIGLVAQAIFIKILGSEYLGINGLFTNIISILGIVELGIGSAIIYNLYKPISENNIPKIKALMNFYKKCYSIVAVVVLIVGLSITPFLPFFIDEVTIDINIYIVYILFVVDIVCSYLLSYKRSIINANQKNYIVNLVHIGYLVLLNFLQILVLILSHNYYLYLLMKIGMRILENVVITIISNKMYPYLLDNDEVLDKTTKDDIFKKVKALFFHKIGAFIVLGTDNIIISKFLGIISVGLYSNYYLIINSVQVLFGQMITSLTPSIGNLLVEDNKNKNYDVFKKLRFINFWIACFTGTAILVIMDSFITIWIGKEYILSIYVLIVLVFNYYQKSMRNSYMSFKEAAGIYYEDRFVPLVESLLNIVFSIIFVKMYGLAGVFMGTIVSGLALWCFSYPKYVYKKLFNRSYFNYFKETFGYIILFCLIASGTYYLSTLVNISNSLLLFFTNVGISLLVPNLLLLIIFFKTDNFKYYLSLFKSFFRKKVR